MIETMDKVKYILYVGSGFVRLCVAANQCSHWCCNPHPFGKLRLPELLACPFGAELLADLFAFSFPQVCGKENRGSAATARSGQRSSALHLDYSNLPIVQNKKPIRMDGLFVLELLARFELATSSLPTILKRFLPCASYRRLLDKNLVYQGLFGFACCSLL